jgi:hypothetical protein
MAKININADTDYAMGFLRFGHYEGNVEIPDEDIEIFKADPISYIINNDLTTELDFLVDDYRIEDIGEINDVNYTIWQEEGK